MRQSPKQNRARNKNGRKANGPSLNRVYESSGPEGKVRGTPQQIIEKYLSLARDKATAGDRVMSESFLQHAEHYVRILGVAQAAHAGGGRREDPDANDAEFESEAEHEGAERAEASGAQTPALAVIGEGGDEGRTDIVETPENVAADRRATRRRGDEDEDAPRRRRRPQRRQNRGASESEGDGADREGGEAGGGQRAAAREADAGPDSLQEVGGAAN